MQDKLLGTALTLTSLCGISELCLSTGCSDPLFGEKKKRGDHKEVEGAAVVQM